MALREARAFQVVHVVLKRFGSLEIVGSLAWEVSPG